MSGDNAKYQAAMSDGHSFAWQLQWEAAIVRYSVAVDEFPEDPTARNCLATAHYRAGNVAEALKHYERLIDTNAADDAVLTRVLEIRTRDGESAQITKAYLDLADYRQRAGRRSDAAATWRDLAGLQPDNLEAQERLYQAVSRAGESALASQAAQTITRLRGKQASKATSRDPSRPSSTPSSFEPSPSSPASGNDELNEDAIKETLINSRKLLRGGRTLHAIDMLLGGICMAPTCLPLHECLAEAQSAQGSRDQSISTLTNVAKLYVLRGEARPAIDTLQRLQALRYSDVGTWERAIALLVEDGEPEQAALRAVELSRYLVDTGRASDAVGMLEGLVSRLEQPAILASMGQALEAAGRAGDAVRAYQVALLRGAGIEAALRLAVVASALGEFPVAVAGLEVIVDAVAAEAMDCASACNAFAEALALDVSSVELHVAYGVILAQIGFLREAVDHLSMGGECPGLLGAVARLGLARCALMTDACLRHLAVLQRLLGERDSSQKAGWRWVVRESQRIVAEMALSRGDDDKAVVGFENVLRLKPDDVRAHSQLAEVHFRRSDNAAAAAALERLGDLHCERGRDESAVPVYRAALQVAKENVGLGRKLAHLYGSTGRMDEALAVLGQLADDVEASGRTGDAAAVLREMVDHSRKNDPALALTLRERIGRLMPDDADAGQDLIACHLAAGNSSKALAEALRLGHKMQANGRFAEARGALQQALRIDPWNEDALLSLGETYELSGDCDVALETYHRVVSSDPHNAKAKGRIEEIEAHHRKAR